MPGVLLSVSDALALAAAGPDEVGVLTGHPVLAVDVDGAAPSDLARLATLTSALPCVTVGVSRRPLAFDAPPPPFDVLLSDVPEVAVPPWRSCLEGVDGALRELEEAVGRAPQAAAVLVGVLRLGRGRSLEDGLAVESLAYATLQAGAEHRAWLDGRAQRERRVPAPAGKDPVDVVRDDGTLVVTLRRPEVRNAVDTAVRDGLVAAFDLATRDDTVACVELRGDGPDFSSGGDLDEFGTTPDPATAHLVRASRSPARALAGCAERTTAYVQGACIGAGVELAALANWVVARPDARFRLPEVAMGLIPGAGGTATIPRRIGPELTAWMALTGTVVDAPTALRWGLVDAIV